MFRNDSQYYVPEMMQTMYNGRVIYKKRMLKQNKNMKKQKTLN